MWKVRWDSFVSSSSYSRVHLRTPHVGEHHLALTHSVCAGRTYITVLVVVARV